MCRSVQSGMNSTLFLKSSKKLLNDPRCINGVTSMNVGDSTHAPNRFIFTEVIISHYVELKAYHTGGLQGRHHLNFLPNLFLLLWKRVEHLHSHVFSFPSFAVSWIGGKKSACSSMNLRTDAIATSAQDNGIFTLIEQSGRNPFPWHFRLLFCFSFIFIIFSLSLGVSWGIAWSFDMVVLPLPIEWKHQGIISVSHLYCLWLSQNRLIFNCQRYFCMWRELVKDR